MSTANLKLLLIALGFLTVILTTSTVRYLATIIAEDNDSFRSRSLAIKTGSNQNWKRVLDHAETNIQSHLPQLLPHRGAVQTTVGTKVVLDNAVQPNQEMPPVKTTIPPPAKQKLQSSDNKQCKPMPHTDYQGFPLVWGPSNKLDSAEECCNACMKYAPKEADGMPCNVWVWCGDAEKCKDTYRDCWLKYLVGGEERAYHTVVTAQGSAVHWQARVHYYWFLKIKKQCQAKGRCQMGGFTRLLHSGVPDELMDEIPSFVVDPLPPEHPNHGYVVLNRPYALVQWLQRATIKERYLLMSEPDHIWLKPMPNLMNGEHPAAFPFFYIEPWTKEHKHITEIFTGPLTRSQAESIAPIGNAPTLISLADMKRVAPRWMNMSLEIFKNPVSNKAWGWVQEMYAFTITCYVEGVGPIDTYVKMMSQPPWDTKMDPYFLLHYTYGMDYTLEGVFTPGKIGAWRFDKRSYSQMPPPRNLGEPPVGMPNELVRHLIHAINEATNAIPSWDEYSKTGKATQLWDGKLP